MRKVNQNHSVPLETNVLSRNWIHPSRKERSAKTSFHQLLCQDCKHLTPGWPCRVHQLQTSIGRSKSLHQGSFKLKSLISMPVAVNICSPEHMQKKVSGHFHADVRVTNKDAFWEAGGGLPRQQK
jgi:hypothetical protein